MLGLILVVLVAICVGVFVIANNTKLAPPEPEQEVWQFMCEQPGGWHEGCPGPYHP